MLSHLKIMIFSQIVQKKTAKKTYIVYQTALNYAPDCCRENGITLYFTTCNTSLFIAYTRKTVYVILNNMQNL